MLKISLRPQAGRAIHPFAAIKSSIVLRLRRAAVWTSGNGLRAQTRHCQGASEASNDLRAQNGYKRPAEVNINSATGQPYVVYEGTLIETALMNRLDGDASGPVKVLVTNPVYSHDHQHVLIPDGTVVLGETHKIGTTGFGHQRRLAVVFHRMIMPDGYSVDLDQFLGLNQIGETGLKDKVNNHYFQIFGSSIALGSLPGPPRSPTPAVF